MDKLIAIAIAIGSAVALGFFFGIGSELASWIWVVVLLPLLMSIFG